MLAPALGRQPNKRGLLTTSMTLAFAKNAAFRKRFDCNPHDATKIAIKLEESAVEFCSTISKAKCWCLSAHMR